MNLNIELINGSHFEWLCFQYLLKNFFPEINNILYINYPKKISEVDGLKLGISANLDTKLNGINKYNPNTRKRESIIYNLDDNVKIPYIFWTGEPFNIEVKSKTGKHKYIIISSLTQDGSTIKMPFASFWYINFYLKDYINKYRNKNFSKEILISIFVVVIQQKSELIL